MKKQWFRILASFCTATFLITGIPITASAAETTLSADADAQATTTTTADALYTDGAVILGEVESLRDATTKYYRRSDGLLVAAMYNEPVHYQDDGEWKEIDNTLVAASDDNTRYYTNKANDFRVQLPGELHSSAPAAVEKDGYRLEWTLQTNQVVSARVELPVVEETVTTMSSIGTIDATGNTQLTSSLSAVDRMTVEKKVGTLSYAEVFEDATLQYDVVGNKVKESLILEAVPTQTSYTFFLSADGLQAQLQEDGSVRFYAPGMDVPTFMIASPYMFDDAHEYSRDISVTLQAVTGGYNYTITPSRAWLTSNERQYPVTIDPTIQTDVDRDLVSATQAYSRYKEQNYHDAHLMYAGTIKASDGNVYNYRSFIKLTMPDRNTNVRYRVVSARMYLAYFYDESGSENVYANNTQINLHEVTSSWDETTLTWSNSPSYDTTISDYSIGKTTDTQISFDITSLADKWYNNPNSNYGVVLKSNETATGSDNICVFSEDTSGIYADCRPTAVIVYRECNGLEDYWTYTTMSVGRSATASVNNATGALTSVIPLCGVDGNLMPVSLSLVYNSDNSANASYGGKWRLNYQMKVEPVTIKGAINCKFKFTDGDGTVHYFSAVDGVIKDEDGLGLTLTENTSSTTERYTLTDLDRNTMTFNSYGNLTYIRDTNGHDIEIIYDTNTASQKITQIKDGADRSYYLTYTGDKLVSVRDPDVRYTTLSHNYSENLLTGIMYPDAVTTAIAYEDGHLVTLTGTGQRIRIHYDNSDLKRVSRLVYCTPGDAIEEEWIGGEFTFTYHFNATTVKDLAGAEVTYQFNEYLQTVCIVSHADGQVQSFKYGAPGGTGTGQENRLLMSSATQKSTVNRMPNNRVDSNFEEDGSYYRAVASGQTGSVTWDSTRGHTANGSIKVSRTAISTSTNPYIYGQRNYTIDTTGYYAISAFVNTNGTTLSPGPGAIIRLERWRDGSGLASVQATTAYTPADEWQRLGTTLYCEAGDTLKVLLGTNGYETMGTMWFDDIQVELLTETINQHNLLDNGDFSNGSTAWTSTAGTWTVTDISTGTNATGSDASAKWDDKPAEATKAIRVTGGAFGLYRLYQTVLVTNGKKGDAYSLGAWAKAYSASINPNASGDGNRAFSICLEFTNTDGTMTRRRISFNRAYPEWQFVSGEAVAAKDYTAVKLYLEYSYNVNTVLFAMPYLYKDNYGQSYTYDKSGNVISAADQTQNQTAYSYNKNQIGKLASPTGSTQLFSHNENTNNLVTVMSTNGQRYEYTSDTHGNVTKAVVGVDTFATTLEAGKTYVLRNAATGNAFDSTGLTADCIYRNWRFIATSTHQPITLVATSEAGVFAMHPYSDSSLRVDVEGGVDTTGARIQLWTATDNAPQLFKIVYNTDANNGTFRILTKISNYEKCIDGQPGDEIDGSNGAIVSQQPFVEGDVGQQWYFIEYSPSLTDTMYMQSTATYTADGNYTATITDQLENVTTYETDTANGNPLSVTTPDGVKTTYGYDESGYQNTSVTVTDKNNVSKGTVSYAYDGDGRLTGISRTNGTSYAFTYDDFGRSHEVWVGAAETGRNLARYFYNSAGLLSTMRYGDGTCTSYYYDDLGRKTSQFSTGYASTPIEYVYNDRGQLALMKDYPTNSRTRYWYDLAGRLVHIRRDRKADADIDSIWGEVYNYYDNATNLLNQMRVRTRVSSSIYDYVYGDIDQGQMPDSVYSVKLNGTTEISYTYDKLGRITRRTLNLPGRSTTYDYRIYVDTATQTVHFPRSSTQVSTMGVGDSYFTYAYDAMGNMTGYNRSGAWGTSATYTYDSLNQLTAATVNGVNYAYTYDGNGNITTSSIGGTTHTYTYGDSVWKDLLTAYDGTAITYDEIGNPLTYLDGLTFTWRNGRELATMTKDGVTTTYVYNADGGRYTKTVGDTVTQYYYVGGKLYAETTGNNTLVYLYDETGTPYAFTYNGVKYYYEYDLTGDVIGLYDSTGTRVVRYHYTPYGDLASMVDNTTTGVGSINPIRYRGYYYDAETGFYLTGTRYYDPEIGRFINADNQISGVGSDIRGYNLFAYCFNNPVNMSDPTGNWPRWITATVAAVATVVAVVATVVSAPVVATVAATVAVVSTVAYVAQSHHYDKRKAKNTDLPAKKSDAINQGWKSSEDPTNPQADCHQYTSPDKTNVKFVSPDGHREVIYNSAGDMVLDSRDIGTYNFSPSGTFWGSIGHFFADMLPWYLFGNDDDDPGPLANEIIRLFE